MLVGGMLFLWGAYGPAQAQQIDPSMLERMQQMGGERGTINTRSPVDRSRERSTQSMREREQREAEAEWEGQFRPKEYSELEKDYQRRSDALLEQYGYDIFESRNFGDDVVTGRAPDNYILGVGDEVVITFHGSTRRSETVTVDREGRVVFMDLPPVDAAGREFADVRAEIQDNTSSTLIGTEAYVSVGALRLVSVYVVGEVERPGLYRLTSLSSVLEALNAAGGVRKTGTLRRIRVVRGDESRNVDLYRLFAGTGGGELIVQDGDRIVIPTIGATAAVSGPVVRPGIYELDAQTSARDLLGLAGGSLRPSGFGMLVNRIDSSGRQLMEDVTDPAHRLSGGDILSVYNRRGEASDVIKVSGHVHSPGRRSLSRVATLRELLPDTGMFREHPYLLFGVIKSSDPATRSPRFKPFSPMKVLFGTEDSRLQNRDEVIFFSRQDIQFLSSPVTRQVIMTGAYYPEDWQNQFDWELGKDPDRCQPLERLAQLVSDTRSERFATTIRAVFTQADEKGRAVGGMPERRALQVAERQRLREARPGTTQGQPPSRTDRDVQLMAEWDRDRELREEEDEFAHLREDDDPNCPAIYDRMPGLLAVVLEYVASADGSVRDPGVYPIVDETPVSALAAAAGGTTTNVDLTKVELLRFDARPEMGDTEIRREFVNAADA
ncbi:MAG: polysaccharide biosynthesis/export family protein, partial [Sphingomonadales bacterium]